MSRIPRIRLGRLACRPAVSALLVVLAATQAAPAVAGKIYRCGNTFQDLPCAEAKVADAPRDVAMRTTPDSEPCGTNAKGPAARNEQSSCASRVRGPKPISQNDAPPRQ